MANADSAQNHRPRGTVTTAAATPLGFMI